MRDLFFNTPARAKFLKSEATEKANVTEAILRLALAHPAVHFGCGSRARWRWICRPTAISAERVRAALARRGARARSHEASGEEGGHRVRAFLAGPEEAANTTRSTFLFVGGRFVRDRSLLHALALGYGPLLEKGRYPLAALFLDVPGGDVDVNVHPQKLEVRFARAQEVYAAVRHVVGAAIARAPWLQAADAARPLRTFTQPPRLADGASRGRRAAGRGRGRRGGARARGAARPSAARFRRRSSPAGADRRPRSAPRFFGALAYVGQVAPHLPGVRGARRADPDRSARRPRAGRLRAAAGRPRPPADAPPAAPVPDPDRGRGGGGGRRRVRPTSSAGSASRWRAPGPPRWWCARCPSR